MVRTHAGGALPESVLPSCLLGPLWDRFVALLPEHVDAHPLGCHNPRIPDRTVFEHVIAALVHGSGYEGMAASPGHLAAGRAPAAPRWTEANRA
ncbi:hypothetical protein GCM10010359_43920 [Streptomyces morookaense]|nr:hypothetical protein GCM10010359_43920 [Streptomyces morookaense]